MSAIAPVIVALRWEWFRISHRPGFYVIMGLAAAVVVLILLGASFVRVDGYGIGPSAYPFIIATVMGMAGPFLALLLTILVFSGEYGWGTLRAMQARGMPGWQTILAKMLLASIALAAAWIVSSCLATVVGQITGDRDAPPILDLLIGVDVSWEGTVLLYCGSLLAAIAYMSLTTLLCMQGRSATFGLAVAAAIVIAERTVYPAAGAIVDALYGFNLWDYLRWTLGGATWGIGDGDAEVSAWYFALALAAYIALFWSLALGALSRRDLGGGSG